MLRVVYVCLLRLHPSYFRRRFADEMLSIFDEETERLAAVNLVADGALSLLRQWTIRQAFWQEPTPALGSSSEGFPSFHIVDDGRLPSRALFRGIMLSVAVFCVFWLMLIYGWNPVPERVGSLLVQEYGLAVLSPNFDADAEIGTHSVLPIPNVAAPTTFWSKVRWPSAWLPFPMRSKGPLPRTNSSLQAVRVPAPQSPQTNSAPLPSFEVASIKPYRGGIGVGVWGNINPPAGPVDRIALTGRTTKQLIQLAYNIQDRQLSVGASWNGSERFDINAKIEDSIVAEAVAKKLTRSQQLDQVRLMLQSLLADRFNLKIHHETKELPIYALIVAKGGLKVTPLADSPNATGPKLPPPAGEAAFATLGSANDLAGELSRMPGIEGRVVIDATGLTGDYLWHFHWTPDSPAGLSGSATQPDSSGPSLFTAIQEQLGLKLESRKGPVDTIVVDHIEEPSPN